MLKSVFTFPNPVNEVAARMVAGMVVSLALVIIVTGRPWLTLLLAYGFLARVAAGPTLSPMGLLATRVLVPLFGNPSRPVPGPPKRFAQLVGLFFSTAALVLFFVAGAPEAGNAVLAVLILFAALEASIGFCAGCFVFGHMMRWGVIPESVCRECVVRPDVGSAPGPDDTEHAEEEVIRLALELSRARGPCLAELLRRNPPPQEVLVPRAFSEVGLKPMLSR